MATGPTTEAPLPTNIYGLLLSVSLVCKSLEDELNCRGTNLPCAGNLCRFVLLQRIL